MKETITKKDFFFCYTPNLMIHLIKDKGLRFIFCARSEIDNYKFWLFQQSNELSEALRNYVEKGKIKIKQGVLNNERKCSKQIFKGVK